MALRSTLALGLVAAVAVVQTGCAGVLRPRGIASEGLENVAEAPLPRLPGPERARPETGAEPATRADAHEAHEAHDAHEDAEPASDGMPAAPAAAPAIRYAAMDKATCEDELARRGASFDRVDEARGVVAPVRLRGPLSGVTYRSMLPPAQRRTSPYEIVDCRLALALDDLAKVLAKHDVVEVVHYSMYRPPPAKTVLNGAGRRHSGALAIDLGALVTKDGKTILVEKDFHGGIGQKPCGPKSPKNPSELRALYCEIAEASLFNVMLSPDYNWAHRNHFHLEVTHGVRWLLVR